jgi:hypothetical protein
VLDRLVIPAGHAALRLFNWFRWIQRGSVHEYILYILVTLMTLLALDWKG